MSIRTVSLSIALLALAPLSAQAQVKGVKYPLTVNALACRTVDDANTFRKLLQQEDMEAVYAYRAERLQAGQCRDYLKGDELIVMDVTAFDDMPYECSRLQGDPTCYWLPAYFLKAIKR